MGYSEPSGPGLYPISRIVRICRINGVEEQLYEVLDQLWKKNKESSILLYVLDEDESKIEQIIANMKDANELYERIYKDYTKNDNTLNRIHRQIDLHLYLQEKDEDEAQREIFEASYPYDPPD